MTFSIPFTHKYIKVSKAHKNWGWFDFHIFLDRACTGAGFHFKFEIFGFNFAIELLDKRPWDYEGRCWYTRKNWEDLI